MSQRTGTCYDEAHQEHARRLWWLIVGAFILLPISLWAEQHAIYVKTSPRLEAIRPLSEPTAISILVTAADGKPVQEGWIEIALQAPPPGRWFSTDFPLVEGTRLVDMRLDLTRGKAEWRYLFPIRGEYVMTVDFVTPMGKVASRVFKFTVSERGTKWLFLAAFTLALFALGFVSGRIFSPVRTGRPQQMIGCLAICFGSIAWASADVVKAAGPGSLGGSLEIDSAVVGRPARVRWRLDGDLKPNSRASLTLTITHLEKGMPVFAVEKLPVGKEFLMNFQFTDGAEYRLRAVAEIPAAPAFREERIVRVTTAEPPARAILAPMILFLSALGGGLAAGRWSRRRRGRATALRL